MAPRQEDQPQGIPFQLQTDWPGLNECWNRIDETCGDHHGPYVVLEGTNQRKCLRCLYADAFTSGMFKGCEYDGLPQEATHGTLTPRR
jgi:hypothetical protein